ncbi:MAG: hypothetical protein KKA60_02860 [Proteobacteria bacterium]|nr:hypothetical protein [Pseudomonadota bacterium]
MEYYESQFRSDLLQYCQGRSDAVVFRDTILRDVPELQNPRNIRFGTSGWEPVKKHDFYFCLYFTVLTDMALHSHFLRQHAMFDRIAMYPKLLGMGFKQRLLPASVLFDIRFRRNDAAVVEQLWRSYCAYFLRDWQESLPRFCGVDGLDFLRALLADPDLCNSAKRDKLEYAEREDGGYGCPDGKGDCFDPSNHLESLLLEVIRDEVCQLEEDRAD